MALRAPRGVRDRFPGLRRRLVRADALSRPRLLPVGRCRADPDACAHCASARASRKAPTSSPRSTRRSARSFRRTRSATIVDNIGMPVSGINMTYNNTGTIGTQDGDIQIKLREGHRPTAEYVRILREELPARFPGVTFSFLPADIISQILNFGAPAPIDLQIRGPQLAGEFRLRAGTAAPAAPCAGPCRRAHPAIAQQSGLQRRCRPHARAICRRHRARRDQQHGGQPRRLEPGRADLLAQSGQRRVLFDRDADAAIPDGLAERAARTCRSRRRAGRSRRSARSPTSTARRAAPSSRNTTSRRWCRSTPPRRDAISARSRPTCRRSSTR